jgi:hypothetical protein
MLIAIFLLSVLGILIAGVRDYGWFATTLALVFVIPCAVLTIALL